MTTSAYHRRSPRLSRGIRKGLTLLLEAQDCADLFDQDPWNFALSFHVLQEVRLSETELRSLVCAGFVETAEEIIPASEGDRSFRPIGRLAISLHSCVILTEGGTALARELNPRNEGGLLGRKVAILNRTSGTLRFTPTWDKKLRQMRLGRHVVKEFTRAAPWQELILHHFQEANWAPFILDPLPEQDGQDPEPRLHSVLVDLNDRQDLPGIRFYRDGTGRIRWQLRFF